MLKCISKLLRSHFSITIGNKRVKVYFICHALPERSFSIRGKQLPLCSRCLGILMGGTFTFPLALQITPSFILLPVIFALILPVALDGVTQLYGLRNSNNYLRFLSGILAGLAVSLGARLVRWILLGT